MIYIIKNILFGETLSKYCSKLFNIALNHRFASLDCGDQNVVQTCPELTKILPSCDYFPPAGSRQEHILVPQPICYVMNLFFLLLQFKALKGKDKPIFIFLDKLG